MEGEGLPLEAGEVSASLGFVELGDVLGCDKIFRRLAGGEPVRLPSWTGVGSVGGGLDLEYLYCLSIREDGGPRYVRTDNVDCCTVDAGPLGESLGCTNGTVVTSGTVCGIGERF